FVVLLAACGAEKRADPSAGVGGSATERWTDVLREARGQTVNWWMYGGDERVNAYVRRHVRPALRRLGVELRQVPISDTADAVQRVVAQRRAGKTSGGSVDLIWLNGENFASGKKAGLWRENWAPTLPNARDVDWDDPSIAEDFQVPVDGQEAPWSRAAFIFAADRERVSDPPGSLDALLAWARRHPGRFTYPAPPDFTGSAFLRQVVQAKGEDAAFAYLRELKPLMYRRGEVLPRSEAELNELFGNAKVDFAMSYDANFVLSGVRKGQFPRTAVPFLIGGGALTNVSYVTIPSDAANAAGAQVVANVLLGRRLQALKADPKVLGNPTVLDLERLPADVRRRFEAIDSSPYLLDGFGTSVQELSAARVGVLEARWKRELLR
ncbi:MAG: ABC transporter substrate-binding protein, partial [Actinobacteria bacterium]|nr:ABC transporter substrate-binding protein [Actinomycetota bacterium]